MLATNSTSLNPKDWRITPEIQATQRKIFTSTLVLKHFDPNLPAIVETDASDFALGAVLPQRYDKRLQ